MARAGPAASPPASTLDHRTERSPRPNAGDPHAALRVRLALAVGLTALATALGVVLLAGSPVTVAGTDGVPVRGTVAYLPGGQVVCQPGGVVPQGTDAVRISLGANAGPTVGVRITSGYTLVSEGSRGAGWGITESVTVPVRRVARTVSDTSVCATLGAAVEPIAANGELVARRDVRLRTEYLRPGSDSWLALAGSIAGHMGIGRAPSGTWVAYLVIALVLAVSLVVVRALLRELQPTPAGAGVADGHAHTPAGRLSGVPRGAWLCALVAVLNAASWSLLTPPFQAPDEPAHFAYVQLLAETGRLPSSNQGVTSLEEATVLGDLHQSEVEWHPETHTISTPSQQRQLTEDLSSGLSRVGPGDAGVAASEPPGYYALEAIPYELGSSGTLLDRLALMRLLSALMAGLTGLFVFLFVRESLPGAAWAWIVGGMAAALMPLLAFASGAVNPDAMLCAVCAASFYCLARAFRRGLTRRLAIALGALTAAGLLTKLSFIGLVPGIALGLLTLTYRQARGTSGHARRNVQADGRALRPLAAATALALSPALVYVASNLVEHHHTLGIVSSGLTSLHRLPLTGTISYVWQFYLPRLPGMFDYFPGLSTSRELWFDRTVGLYGWLDTAFPVWVYDLALVPAGAIVLLALRAILIRRQALRPRLAELLVYAVIGVGVLVLIAAISYQARGTEGESYLQPRYLLPLLSGAAALLALAARGAGRRWGPAVGVLIVVLFLAQDVFSQLQVVARYYG
jgi:Predicted membrane protein (DUF2142)